MKRLVFLVALSIFLTACSSRPGSGILANPPALPDKGAAPELKNEVWINADQPLKLAELKGKVVLIDMWTYG